MRHSQCFRDRLARVRHTCGNGTWRNPARRAQGHAAASGLVYVWAGLMLFVAIGSFWIAELRLWGRESPIHRLSLLVIVPVPLAIWRAQRHDADADKRGMIALYTLALVVTGLFTLWSDRILHKVLFGA